MSKHYSIFLNTLYLETLLTLGKSGPILGVGPGPIYIIGPGLMCHMELAYNRLLSERRGLITWIEGCCTTKQRSREPKHPCSMMQPDTHMICEADKKKLCLLIESFNYFSHHCRYYIF